MSGIRNLVRSGWTLVVLTSTDLEKQNITHRALFEYARSCSTGKISATRVNGARWRERDSHFAFEDRGDASMFILRFS